LELSEPCHDFTLRPAESVEFADDELVSFLKGGECRLKLLSFVCWDGAADLLAVGLAATGFVQHRELLVE
jgi:hypothetical protein